MGFSRIIIRSLCTYIILNIQCSLYKASPLIGTGVKQESLKKFPFIASLSFKTCSIPGQLEPSHFCGGSLITPDLVLTAAHCLKEKTYGQVVVRIGSTDSRNIVAHRVLWWQTYSGWSTDLEFPKHYGTMKDSIWDIAVIKLEDAVSSDFPFPTISYIPDEEIYNKSILIGVWDYIDDRIPKNIRIGRTSVLPPEQCHTYHLFEDAFLKEFIKNIWPQIYLCTKGAPVVASEPGDSGSPVLYDKDNKENPNNIVAVNKGACLAGEESMCEFINSHSSVNAYEDFIEAMKIM